MASLAEVGWEVRMQHVQGAVIAGAIFEIIIGVSGLVGKILKFVGPITIAPTIALIGLSLFKFGAPTAGALPDWWFDHIFGDFIQSVPKKQTERSNSIPS